MMMMESANYAMDMIKLGAEMKKIMEAQARKMKLVQRPRIKYGSTRDFVLMASSGESNWPVVLTPDSGRCSITPYLSPDPAVIEPSLFFYNVNTKKIHTVVANTVWNLDLDQIYGAEANFTCGPKATDMTANKISSYDVVLKGSPANHNTGGMFFACTKDDEGRPMSPIFYVANRTEEIPEACGEVILSTIPAYATLDSFPDIVLRCGDLARDECVVYRTT